jgi:hypothetical protein
VIANAQTAKRNQINVFIDRLQLLLRAHAAGVCGPVESREPAPGRQSPPRIPARIDAN